MRASDNTGFIYDHYRIGDYQVNTKYARDNESFSQKAQRILGDKGMAVLHEGTDPVTSTEARRAFLNHLKVVAETGPRLERPTSKNPGDDAISMEKFLGKEGIALYKAAIKEEMRSKEFRDAVLVNATTHYDGPRLDKPMVVGVGGPSACGKSFAADSIVSHMLHQLPIKQEGNTDGNNVVAVDGGIERVVSQMRQMTLLTARQMGYPGINGLDNAQKIGAKAIIYEAAQASGQVSLVIPETHAADTIPGRNMLELSEKTHPEKTHIFGMVTPAEGHTKDEWRDLVKRMGEERAWANVYGTNEQPSVAIAENNLKIGCESKRYESQHFDRGYNGSEKAMKQYMENSRDKIYVKVENDLTYLYGVRLTEREVAQWKSEWPLSQLSESSDWQVKQHALQQWHAEKVARKDYPPALLTMTCLNPYSLLTKDHFVEKLAQMKARTDAIFDPTIAPLPVSMGRTSSGGVPPASPGVGRARADSFSQVLLSKLRTSGSGPISRVSSRPSSGVFSRISMSHIEPVLDTQAQKVEAIREYNTYVIALKKSQLPVDVKEELFKEVHAQVARICKNDRELMQEAQAILKIMKLNAGKSVTREPSGLTTIHNAILQGFERTPSIEKAKSWLAQLQNAEGSAQEKMQAAEDLRRYARSCPDENAAAGTIARINLFITQQSSKPAPAAEVAGDINNSNHSSTAAMMRGLGDARPPLQSVRQESAIDATAKAETSRPPNKPLPVPPTKEKQMEDDQSKGNDDRSRFGKRC